MTRVVYTHVFLQIIAAQFSIPDFASTFPVGPFKDTSSWGPGLVEGLPGMLGEHDGSVSKRKCWGLNLGFVCTRHAFYH